MSNSLHGMQKSGQPAPYSARLVQLLSVLANSSVGEPTSCFAERLGRLFDLSDTILLDSAHKHRPAGPFPASSTLAERLQANLEQTRDTLVDRISGSFAADATSTALRLPEPEFASTPARPPAFTPYRRFYLAQQRQLATALQPLRARIRNAMANQSPALAQLAALDTVFDNTLSNYSRHCFGALPTVLEKRFKTLWRAHQKNLPAGEPDDTPGSWLEPGAWLDQFCREMRILLLAELEVRLEPALGLLAALNNEVHNHQ